MVLVLFRDHLPGLDIENEDLGNGDRYQTGVHYLSTILEVKDRDLCAYQLGAHVLKQLGIDAGLLAKLHQTMENHENYLEALEMLEYDLISGAQIAYGERGPHPPTDMRMGITEIQITGILPMGDRLVISGAGYTEWSQVYINDRAVGFIDAVPGDFCRRRCTRRRHRRCPSGRRHDPGRERCLLLAMSIVLRPSPGMACLSTSSQHVGPEFGNQHQMVYNNGYNHLGPDRHHL